MAHETSLLALLTEAEAETLSQGCPGGERFFFPLTPPSRFPGEGEVWMMIRCHEHLLPPLYAPPDGDSGHLWGRDELRQATEIRRLAFEELVAHALRQLDSRKPVSHFPFGMKPGPRTWRELVQAGEETHPVWREALRRSVGDW